MFGSSSKRTSTTGSGHNGGGGTGLNSDGTSKGGPPNTPTYANSSVLLAGLMGLRPRNNPALSTGFATGSSSGLGRRPALAKRTLIGGL